MKIGRSAQSRSVSAPAADGPLYGEPRTVLPETAVPFGRTPAQRTVPVLFAEALLRSSVREPFPVGTSVPSVLSTIFSTGSATV